MTTIRDSEDARDEELVLAFRDHRRDAAYGALVRRYQIRLFRLLLGLLSGGDEAEGACENLFVHAARDIADLDPPSSFYPWLAQRAQALAHENPTLPESHLSSSIEPREHVLSAVRAALDTLSPEQRTALVLSELQRDPPESVARTMGRPLDEVVELIRGARARFVAEVGQVETLRVESSGPPLPEVVPGVTIDGRYRVKRLLGCGGHGAVYEAVHETLGRDVALKVLRPEGAAHELVRERFRREALVLGRLDHECFVDVIDFGETPTGLLYLVLEFLDGQSLGELVAQGPLPVVDALFIVKDILRGLEHLHAREVVHRDIKPDNIILVSRSDGTRLPKILDLGIAKLLTHAATERGGDSGLTQENVLLGTPKYMSPGQAAGDVVDGRADLYSLTVVLFEMLTGDLPFDSKYISAVLTMHISKAPPTLASVGLSDPSTALEALVARGLAKLPEDRFQTATEMREAVEALLAAA